MRIFVRYFARHREIIGRGEERMELSDGSTLADLFTLVGKTHPSLLEHLDHAVPGVNREVSSMERVLKDGDEVAIIPPVGGG